MDKNDLTKVGLSSENLSDIEERLKEVKNRTTEFVKEYPLVSIAIAAGLGFIIARIFASRK